MSLSPFVGEVLLFPEFPYPDSVVMYVVRSIGSLGPFVEVAAPCYLRFEGLPVPEVPDLLLEVSQAGLFVSVVWHR